MSWVALIIVLHLLELILARFAQDADIRSRGSVYASEARKALNDDLGNITMDAIQTCILVGNYCMADCNPNAQSLYFGNLHFLSISRST